MTAQRPLNYRIVSVHGTFATAASIRGPMWWQKGSAFSEEVLSYLDTANHRIFWEPFLWTGKNSLRDRVAAGVDLADRLSAPRPEPEASVCLCHSHGGNVFQHARNRMGRRLDGPRAITVGTPYLAEAATSTFGPMLTVQKGFGFFIYIGLLALLALELFTLPDWANWLLLACVALCALVGALLIYIRLAVTFATGALSGQGGLLGRSFRAYFRRVQRSSPMKDRETARENLRDVKIFSMFDEAILSLTDAHRQRLTVATADNTQAAAIGFWSVAVLLVLLVVANVLGIGLLSDPALAGYQTVDAGLIPDARLAAALNTLADIAVILILCAVAGMTIATLPGAGLFAGLFNRNLNSVLLKKALGQDSSFDLSIASLVSPNLPVLFDIYEPGDLWHPVPDEFDKAVFAQLDAGLVHTSRAIRQTLAMGMLSGDLNIFSSVATNFSGDELVHTSYFKHPDFAGFTAWILVTRHSFPPGPAFATLDAAKFQRWFDHIAPDGLTGT